MRLRGSPLGDTYISWHLHSYPPCQSPHSRGGNWAQENHPSLPLTILGPDHGTITIIDTVSAQHLQRAKGEGPSSPRSSRVHARTLSSVKHLSAPRFQIPLSHSWECSICEFERVQPPRFYDVVPLWRSCLLLLIKDENWGRSDGPTNPLAWPRFNGQKFSRKSLPHLVKATVKVQCRHAVVHCC